MLALGLGAGPAGAQIYGESNFGGFVYPRHSCGTKPVRPYQPDDVRSYTAAQEYNLRVEQYNLELARFAACINDYVERTRLDTLRIRERAEEAIRTLQ